MPRLHFAALLVVCAAPVSLACQGSVQDTPVQPIAAPATTQGVADAERRVAELVSDHHPIDEAWLDQATVVAVGRLETGSYPCIFHEDGSSDMPMSHTFTVEEVLVRGPLERTTIDLSPPGTPSTAWPRDLRDGRRYLLFLDPSPDSEALVADEDEMFDVYTQLGGPEIIAIVDLDASPEDIDAQREAAATHIQREAYVLDDARWQALRTTAGVTGDELMAALHVLRNDRFPAWQTRSDALARLGPPDETGNEGADTVDTYFVNLRDRESPAEGRFVARIELVSDAEGKLMAYREEFLVGRGGALEVAGYEEKKQAGLMWTHVERRR